MLISIIHMELLLTEVSRGRKDGRRGTGERKRPSPHSALGEEERRRSSRCRLESPTLVQIPDSRGVDIREEGRKGVGERNWKGLEGA